MEELSPRQASEFLYALEQDLDWWPAILWKHLASDAQSIDNLAECAVTRPEEWSRTVQDAKASGMPNLRTLPLQKPAQWNVRILALLARPMQAALLQLYLKSVLALRNRRVADIGTRAQTRQRINAVLSASAKEALDSLERYLYASDRLAESEGKGMKAETRTYYEMRKQSQAHSIAGWLGFIFLFQTAASSDDVRTLQRYLDEHFLIPARGGLLTVSGAEETKKLRGEIAQWESLRRAVEIQFD